MSGVRRDAAGRVLMKRFYTDAGVVEANGGYGVALDGRAIKTPGKRALVVPSQALAAAIAAEWQGQGEYVIHGTMVLTKLANTAIDRDGQAESVRAEIMEFAGSDLLCYRAGEPEALVERQQAAFDPVLAWAARFCGSGFVCVTGLMHQPQPAATLGALERHIAAQNLLRLTGLHTLTTLSGSALLAIAMGEGELSAKEAWDIAHTDETWQAELWGSDEEAAERLSARHGEFMTAGRFLEMV